MRRGLLFGVFIGLHQCVVVDGSLAELNSPSGVKKLTFDLSEDGRPTYDLYQGEIPIVLPSTMGLEIFAEGSLEVTESLFDNFELDGSVEDAIEFGSHDEVWRPLYGEEEEIRDHHEWMLVRLRQKDEKARQMHIRFKLFDDGLGFRYEFPAQPNLVYYRVKEERTQFAMSGDHMAWWIPGDYDTQEWIYQASHLSYIRYLHDGALHDNVSTYPFSKTGVQTALQMRSEEGMWINIHEAALVNYSCMHLDLDDTNMIFETHLTPDVIGVKAHLQAPNNTPWRTVIAGLSGSDILASRITYNLNEPALEHVKWEEFVKPVKFVGVWWELICGARSWDFTDALPSIQLGITDYSDVEPHGRHGATTERVQEYIDFAAEHGFDAVLVEGWNIGWEDWFGFQKDYVFDFLTPYPDFNLEYLTNYAAEKNVQLMMHHETSASTRNYERHLHRAYEHMEKYGYKSVKSGYVGNMIPHGNHHYSQDMVNHYLYAVQEAAKYGISVNTHEAVHPTGLARTYPNWIAQESARGQEYRGTPPNHLTILPFTRLIGGPMDYTPGVFNMYISQWVGNEWDDRVLATIANQLGLYLTMYSPLQMAADTIENYTPHIGRAFEFIKEVPITWKKSVYLETEPGRYVTIARLDRHSDNWYMGCANSIDPRYAEIKLSFLNPDTYYHAKIYYDAPGAHYYNNPHAYDIREEVVTSESTFLQWVASGGGFAVSFTPIDNPIKSHNLTAF